LVPRLFALLRWPCEDGLRLRRAAGNGHLSALSPLTVGAFVQGISSRHGRLDGEETSSFDGSAHERRVADRPCGECQTYSRTHSRACPGPQADGSHSHSGWNHASRAIGTSAGKGNQEWHREAHDDPDGRAAFRSSGASECASGACRWPLDTSADHATPCEHGSAVYAKRADEPRSAEQAFHAERPDQPSHAEPSVYAHHAAVQPTVERHAPTDDPAFDARCAGQRPSHAAFDTERAQQEQATGEPTVYEERAQQATGQPAFGAECAQQEQTTGEPAVYKERAQQATSQPAFGAECAQQEQATGEPAVHKERAQQATSQPAFDTECAQQEQATGEPAHPAESAQQTTG
jgi:hypothetical protein